MSWEVDLDGQGGGDDGEGAGGLPGFLADPRGVLKRRWRWMVPIVLVGLVLTGVYLKRRQDVYTARATVLIASQRISGALIPIAETDQLEKVSAIVGELLSRRNLTALIEKHGLYPPTDKGEELPLDKKVGIMRAVTRIAIDDSNTANMNRESTATVFEIFYTSLDPQKAADVANDLARGFTD
ncbi:MAG TPA: hypothetical protein PLW10_18600, partial [Myxococcota bacterium]|nr:hypothetical protein [Myxococcota bacterium]